MDDIKVKKETIKEIKDMNEAPRLESNKMLYNCSECSSTIEIISFNENNIEFKCNNKHNIKMEIKDYLNKMKKYTNIKLNDKACDEHGEEYLSYCFDCDMHLCKECLKLGKHSYHYKIILIELTQNSDSLNEIFELIKQNKIKLKNLNISKNKTEKKLYDLMAKNINEIKNKLNEKKELNNKNEKEEININNNNFKKEIKKLKEEYEKQIKKIKLKYDKNNNYIRNKFKKINNIDNYIYNKKIENLEQNIKLKIDSYKFEERIEKLSNYNEILEIIYNTYIKYDNNYYNAININNIYNMVFNKENNNINYIEYPKNKIKNYEIQIKEKNNLIKKYEQQLKEKDNIISEKTKINDERYNLIEKCKKEISNKDKENLNLKEKILFLELEIPLFQGSKIILDINSKIFLKYCLCNNKIQKIKTNLIYSATINGDTNDAFNSKCNGQTNTLTIIKTNNDKIIGGFFKKPINVKEKFYDPDSFLFSVKAEEKYDVNPNGQYKNYSFWGTGSNSEVIINFGYGSSIHIINNCLNSERNYYCGRNETFKFPRNRLTNSDVYFKVIEFEVYKIEYID